MANEATSQILKDLVDSWYYNTPWLGGQLHLTNEPVLLERYMGYELWAIPIDKTKNELFMDLSNPGLRVFLHRLADGGLDVTRKYRGNEYVFLVAG